MIWNFHVLLFPPSELITWFSVSLMVQRQNDFFHLSDVLEETNQFQKNTQ